MTTWEVKIDWDKDGAFTEPQDSIWEDVMDIAWRLGMNKPHQSLADESTCQITVRNHDGKYTPENSASPLYGKLLPQRPVQVSANGQVLWRGWTERLQVEWQPAGGQTGRTRTVIHCIGAKQFLQEAEVNLPLQQNKRGDQIIAEVLRRVVLPPSTLQGWILGKVGFSELGTRTRLARESDYSTLDEGILTFRYYGDVRDTDQSTGSDGYRIIKDITEAERGKFFFDRLGKAVWWNRSHLLDDSLVDDAVDSSGVAGIRPHAVDYRYGVSLSNSIQVMAYPRRISEEDIPLWELNKALTIPSGATLRFEAPYTDQDQKRAGAFSASTTGEVFSAGSATISLTSQAERAHVTLRNTGASDAVLTGLQITGQALTSNNRVVIQAQDAASVRAYGRRGELRLNLRALEDVEDAYDIADLELRRRGNPYGEVHTLSFMNSADDSANAAQLAWEIGTRLAITLPELNHAAEYFILGESHQVSGGGKVHQTTYVLEQAILTRLAHYRHHWQDADVTLKGSSTHTRLAQGFQVSRSGPVASIRLWLRKRGDPSGQLALHLYNNHPQGGTWYLGQVGSSELGSTTRLAAECEYPDTVIPDGSSQAVALSGLDTAYGWVEFRFNPPVDLTEGVPYWAVLEHDSIADPTHYAQWGADGTAPTYPDGEMLSEQGGSWKREHKVAIFEVYR